MVMYETKFAVGQEVFFLDKGALHMVFHDYINDFIKKDTLIDNIESIIKSACILSINIGDKITYKIYGKEDFVSEKALHQTFESAFSRAFEVLNELITQEANEIDKKKIYIGTLDTIYKLLK